jgi:PIN domain nuclease of toxin-antitoxin system
VNLLLDTHLLLWTAFGSARLSPRARDLILSPENGLWFSVASL